MRQQQTPASARPQKGRRWGVFIFLYEEVEDEMRSDANAYCGLCTDLPLFLFETTDHVLLLHVVDMKLTTRGTRLPSLQSLFCFLFSILGLFIFRRWNRFLRLLHILIWRTVLGAHHGETNVDQGGVRLFYFLFSFKLRRGHHPLLLP